MTELSITPKELQTAALLAQGRRRVDVAQEMGVSVNTIKTRIDTLLYKTFSQNSVQMVHVLTKRGLLVLAVSVSLSADLSSDAVRRSGRRRLRPVPTVMVGAA